MEYDLKYDDDTRIEADREEIPEPDTQYVVPKTSPFVPKTSPYRFWGPDWYTSGFQ